MNDTSLYTQPNTTAGGSRPLFGSPMLFIDTSSDATSQAGFMNGTNTTDITTTTNFRFFSTDVYWIASDGTLEAKFWATPTDTDNVWTLIWNEPNTVLDDDSTPVVLQTLPPASDS